jgi:hypothetical protein
MDAPLRDCFIEERGVGRFFGQGKTCGNSPTYVGSVWTEHRVNKRFEWVERFKSGRTHVNVGRSGGQSTSRTQDHIDKADAMIREDG